MKEDYEDYGAFEAVNMDEYPEVYETGEEPEVVPPEPPK